MFKIWSYIIFGLLVFILLVISFELSSFFFFFIYSEVFWITCFLLNLVISSYLNDPRFVVFGFIILLIAAIEIIFVAFYLIFSEKLLS